MPGGNPLDYLADNPHLRFATGETDTGVIVAWNTEGPGNVETGARNVVVLPDTMSINPLNWRLDETYAPASMNLGSLVENEETGEPEIADVGADAQVNLARGVVLTHAKANPLPEEEAKVAAAFFGPDGRHDNDYTWRLGRTRCDGRLPPTGEPASNGRLPPYSRHASHERVP